MIWMIGLVMGGVLLLGLDQWTKWLAEAAMAEGERIPFVDGFLSWKLVYNEGASFGILQDDSFNWPLILFTIALMVVVGWVLFSPQYRRYRLANLSAVLILSGGIGNLIDRLFQPDGRVIDFIHTEFIDFPTFNVADCCVVIGAAMMMLFLVFQYREEKVPSAKETTDGTKDMDNPPSDDGGEVGQSDQ